MPRTMYDSINPGAIPSDATMVAAYQDGLYANVGAMKARFPHATIATIAVRHTSRAHVLDVENGDATPAQAVQWLTQTMHDLDNGLLTVYCNMTVWPAVRAVIKAAGIKEPNWWVARYDNDPTLPPGAVAKQYVGDYNGYDKSVVADYWPGVDPAPPTGTPQWRKLLDHVMAVPEQVYEHWSAAVGWDNVTAWGAEYGEQGVAWCVIWNWCMNHDVGLDSAVPKTDNVTAFSDWAKAHGQWSLYPSVGAWVNFDNGAHTEIVIGFDDQRVYTKGGNSVQAGASDNGQGNGVWSHEELRRATRVTGYFAPRFPDNACPPTADPNDPRGGVAVTSYTPPEDDMTPAQAQQLADLHDMLTSIGSLTETDPKTKKPVVHGAGYYLAHAQQDTAALAKAVTAVGAQAAENGQSLTKALTALTAISTAVTAGGSADSIVTAVKTALEAWHPTITITG